MAQKRRKEQQMKRRQRMLSLLCIAGGLGAVLLSFGICMLVFDVTPKAQEVGAPVTTALPYDEKQPFTISDLTTAQLTQIRQNGRMSVSDGPRGISIGDTLETLMDRLPSTIVEMHEEGEMTGLQSDEEMILYCAEYFVNQNGMSVALPPRGLLTVQGGNLVVTLLAPTSAYPAGTKDNYGSYEHVYCVFTIEPDTMTISSIVLGIDQ